MVVCISSVATQNLCGSGLARESGGSATSILADPTHSRASPLPHLNCGVHRVCGNTNPVGASLLAMAVYQTTPVRLTRRYREQARSHRG
ncbi:protein of unknown function [Pseudomonas mediterranea]